MAARSACSTTAACSGGSWPRKENSWSSTHPQRSCRRDRARAPSASVTRRWARANRSSCPAVIGIAIWARSSSLSAVAILDSARTFAYDSRAAANSARISGRSGRARATRTDRKSVV